MPGPFYPAYTKLDFSQVLRQSFDETTDRLRVDATVTATIGSIVLDAATSDIAIEDRISGYQLKINSDGSIDVNCIISAANDSIRISDGTDTLAINTDGSINANITGSVSISSGDVNVIETGTVATVYNEVLSIASATLTTIVSYTAVQPSRLKVVEVSGTNIAEFTVYVNGSPIHKKRTYYGYLDSSFQFSKGYALVASDVVQVKVLHYQSTVGDFSAFALLLKD